MQDVMSLEAGRPETEVSAKAKRRRYAAEYKRRILREDDACRESGALGALLRREGLYSSHLNTWRAQAERGELAGLAAKKPTHDSGSAWVATASLQDSSILNLPLV